MSITAKYPATCAKCHGHINPGQQIEWTKGQPVRHSACQSGNAGTSAPARRPVFSSPARASGPAPTKVCWECGGTFTQASARRHGGDWGDSYCGC